MGTWIVMPKLGRRMKAGTVGEWYARPGERVSRGQTLLEVITDKVTHEIPSPVDGTLVRIERPSGQTVPIGARLAYLA